MNFVLNRNGATSPRRSFLSGNMFKQLTRSSGIAPTQVITLRISPAFGSSSTGIGKKQTDIATSPTPNGERLIWLDPAVLARLKTMRDPGESYSDVASMNGAPDPFAAGGAPTRSHPLIHELR